MVNSNVDCNRVYNTVRNIEYAIEHTEETTIENTEEYARGRWHLVLAEERRVCKHPVGGSALPSI